MSKIHVRTLSYVERIIDIVQKRSIDDFFAKVLTDYGAAVLAANQSQREGQVTALKAYRDEMRDACSHFQDTSDVEERLTAILESVSPHPPRTLPDDECEELTHATAALQQSYSGITACAEKPSQVVDSGAAGPTRTGDLLITNQGAEAAETLGNQQDTPSAAPVDGAQAAQGESSTCKGVTAGLPAWNEPCAEIAAKADARIAALEAERAERELQEPVAWVLFDDIFIAPKDMPDDPPNLECMKPLYARPPAIREPTEDECREMGERWFELMGNAGDEWQAIREVMGNASDEIAGRAMWQAVRKVMP